MCKDQESHNVHIRDVVEDSSLLDRPLDVRVVFEGPLHKDVLDFLLSLYKSGTKMQITGFIL
jgi:hypothetical protein